MFRRQPVDLAGHAHRYAAHVHSVARGRRVVVWGAGRAGRNALGQLRAHGVDVALVVDRDVTRHGTTLDGCAVAGADALDGPHADFVVIASMYAEEIAADLGQRGFAADRDVTVFPAGAIYQPAAAFAVEALGTRPTTRRSEWVTPSCPRAHEVTLLASAEGSFYFRELRDFLAGGLRRAGWHVATADEHAATVCGVPIVVGPHEFFTVGHGVEWLSIESLRHAVLVTTEHVQSSWTQTFVRALAHAGAVVDLDPAMPVALAARGVTARWLPLGWYDGCDPFDRVPRGSVAPAVLDLTLPEGPLPPADDDAWHTRPVDVLFIGASSPRRVRLLDELREAVPDVRWAVQMPHDGREGSAAVVDTATAVALARRAKVLLNLHRDDSTYVEWQRLVWRGLWQRALVVTDPIEAVPGLVAGQHYLEARPDGLAGVLRDVFRRGPGQHHADAIRRAGFEAARAIRFEAAVQVLSAAVDRVVRGAAA